MSDPMTNTDVEDVLASIRRLVSDGGRPSSAKVQAPPSDRLVLTPSLRVPEAEAVEEKNAGLVQPVKKEQSAEHVDLTVIKNRPVSDPLVLDEDMAADDDLSVFARTAFRKDTAPADSPKVAKAENAPEIDPPAEIVEDVAPQSDSVALADSTAEVPEEKASIVPDPMAELSPADTAESVQESTATTLERDQEASDEEASDQEASDEEKFAAMSRQVSDRDTVSSNLHDTEVPIGPEDWNSEPAGPVEKAPMPAAETATDAPQSLSEKIAALEALVGERRDQFEPDDTGADAYAGTEQPAMEWEDVQHEAPEDAAAQDARTEASDDPRAAERIVEDSVETARPSAANEAIAASASLFASDDDVLDEEALRALISDIVREELQGTLGERITRNVRKLVRREIHRALAAQDLE